LKKLAKIAKVLGDENRLKVLALIDREKEVCVCEVSDTLNISQPLASKYLKQLKDAGIIDSEKRGKWSIYFIKSDEIIVDAFLKELRKYSLPDIKKCERC